MGHRRAWTVVLALTWGLRLTAAPAGAYEPSPDDYSPYAPSGFFVFDWSGYYAGGHLGAAAAEAEATEAIFPNNPLLFQATTLGNSENSVTGGVQAGWQRQFGKLVAGVEAGFNLLGFDDTELSPIVPGLARSVQVSNIFTLTGRVGYAEGRWLAYIKGGLANGEVDIEHRQLSTDITTSSNDRETGWTAGLGVDYALTPNLFLGVEYNLVHFRANVVPPPIPDTQFDNLDVTIQNVVVRLNYRFNPCCAWPGPGRP
ncbi:MAG: porin family protein [Hyphomicrobiaceae bacterium]|nr:porin family protein [Hyphomicrobiaceae bacterium]